MTAQRRARRQHRAATAAFRGAQPDALAAALRAGDMERAALLLLLGVSLAARSLPPGTIEDVLAILAGDEEPS